MALFSTYSLNFCFVSLNSNCDVFTTDCCTCSFRVYSIWFFVSWISFWWAFRLKSLQHHPGLNSDRSIWSNPQLCMSLPPFRGNERRVISVEGDLVNCRDIRGRSASVSAANSAPSNLVFIPDSVDVVRTSPSADPLPDSVDVLSTSAVMSGEPEPNPSNSRRQPNRTPHQPRNGNSSRLKEPLWYNLSHIKRLKLLQRQTRVQGIKTNESHAGGLFCPQE